MLGDHRQLVVERLAGKTDRRGAGMRLFGPFGVGKATVEWLFYRRPDTATYVDSEALDLCLPLRPGNYPIKARNRRS